MQLCRFSGSIAITLVVLSATYVGGSFRCSYEGDCFCCIMQLEVSATLTQVKISAANMWVTIFIEKVLLQVGVCCNHAGGIFYGAFLHDYFYCNYVGGCFRCSHVRDSFK